jgi:hypothetical protein
LLAFYRLCDCSLESCKSPLSIEHELPERCLVNPNSVIRSRVYGESTIQLASKIRSLFPWPGMQPIASLSNNWRMNIPSVRTHRVTRSLEPCRCIVEQMGRSSTHGSNCRPSLEGTAMKSRTALWCEAWHRCSICHSQAY